MAIDTDAEVGGAVAPPTLRLVDVRKTYPGTQALKGVSLTVEAGEVRALVGENGSGKSTLIGILGGKIAPDPGGRVEIAGQPLSHGDPGESRARGIAVIHQELMIVPAMSAVDNVFLGDVPRHGPFVDAGRMVAEYAELADQLGVDIGPRTAAGQLSVAQQTVLEIMRAVRRNVRLLLLDEPTATLGVPEREKLYGIVASLAARGVACIFISHDLDEVLHLCDSVTVFREGTEVQTGPKAEWTKSRLVQAMLGRGTDDVAGLLAEPASAPSSSGQGSTRPIDVSGAGSEPLLSVSGVRARAGRTEVAELDVRAGEIVGIAGLVGSGRSSLLRALSGAAAGSGSMRIDGKEVPWPRDISQALRHGIALLPEDRKHQGLVLGMNAYDNVTLSDLGQVARRGVLARTRSRQRALELLEALNFRGRVDEPVGNLSGGNQQKVLVAKWVHRGTKVLLIDEPTRGVDIGAKAEIMRVIRDLADAGQAIIWVSSELEEVIAVSHRVLLMADGRIVGELRRDDMTTANILDGIFAVTGGAALSDTPEEAR